MNRLGQVPRGTQGCPLRRPPALSRWGLWGTERDPRSLGATSRDPHIPKGHSFCSQKPRDTGRPLTLGLSRDPELGLGTWGDGA